MLLYELAEHCGYGDLHKEMIQDCIVMGIRNSTLSEKLQLDSKLTLESAIAQVCTPAIKQLQLIQRLASLDSTSDQRKQYPSQVEGLGKLGGAYSIQLCSDAKPFALWPVAYVSRAMTPNERRYAQVEKEALAFTWACEQSSDYLTGLKFLIETDHKPLVPLFSSKHLEELPPQVQRFQLRMMCFAFTITHVPGKELVIADTLSRAPAADPTLEDPG